MLSKIFNKVKAGLADVIRFNEGLKDMLAYQYRNSKSAIEWYKIKVTFQKLRADGKNEKTYRCVAADGDFKLPNGFVHIYNMDKLASADSNATLYIVEGEKCADALTDAGLLATTYYAGAQSELKLSAEELNMIIKFKNIVLLPDNDEAGKRLIAAYKNAGVDVDVLPMVDIWPECPPKGDVADYLAAGNSVEAIINYNFPVRYFGRTCEKTADEIVETAIKIFSTFASKDICREDALEELMRNKKLLVALAECDKTINMIFCKKVVGEKIINKGDLKSAITNVSKDALAKKLELEKIDYHNQIMTASFSVDGRNFHYPNNYNIKTEGVFYVKETDKGLKEELVSSDVIIIRRVFHDYDNGLCYVELATFRNDTWNSLPIMPLEDIFDANVVKGLSKYGVDAGSTNSLRLIDYFRAFKAANDIVLKPVVCYSSLGWHKNVFYLANGDDDVYMRVGNDLKNIVNVQGDYDVWKKLVVKVMENQTAKFMIAASLASPLVKIFNAPNYMYMIYGSRGIGKTNILKMCASVWGSDNYILSANATLNFVENRMFVLQNLPVILDETENADSNFTQVIYRGYNGIGRGRLNADSSPMAICRWSNLCIISGENPIISAQSKGGQYRRIIEIRLKEELSRDEKCSIGRIVRDNYGFLGRNFVEYVNSKKDVIKKQYDDFARELLSVYKNVEDSHLFAISMVSMASIYMDMHLLDLDYEAAVQSSKQLAESIINELPQKSTVDDAQRAYEYIIDYVQMNYKHFAEYNQSVGAYHVGTYPSIFGIVDSDWTYFIPVVFDTALKNEGYNPRRIKSDFIELGICKTDKDGNNYVLKLKGDFAGMPKGKTRRFVAIKNNLLL